MKGHLALFVISVSLLSCAQVKQVAKPLVDQVAAIKAHDKMVRREAVVKHESAEDRYIRQQLKIIDAHEKLLVAAGRITDAAHWQTEMYLATYGWHSACGESKGTEPVFCDSGSFGAYSFSQEAYEQAKRIYVIHGTVDAGTDILVDANYGVLQPEADGSIIMASTDGYHSPLGKGAFDPAIVGDSVGFLTYCQLYGNHDKYCDGPGLTGATVVKFIDKGHVRISKVAKHDAIMYGLVITPPDYVDMCACTVPTSAPDPNVKPCVQGGTLNPAESCSVGIAAP